MAAAAYSPPLLFLLLFTILLCCSSARSFISSSSSSKPEAFNVSANCPDILTPSTLKQLNTTGMDGQSSLLRVLVPWKVGFKQFVNFTPDSCRVGGFSVEVFKQALSLMQPRPLYRFVLLGDGEQPPPYDHMVDMLVRKEVDVVVADLTITKDRMTRVDFTLPYLPPSPLVMVTTLSDGAKTTYLDFLTPFSSELWVVFSVCFLFTGLVVFLLEFQNPEFAISSKKWEEKSQTSSHGDFSVHLRPPLPASNHRLPMEHGTLPPNNSNNLINDDNTSPPTKYQGYNTGSFFNAYWFTLLGIFQGQKESVQTHLGRTVTFTWLAIMVVLNASYTASFSSLLSSQKTYPTVDSFQALKKNISIPLGCQEGTFMVKYMKKLDLDDHLIKNFTSEEDYAQALKGNFDRQAVGAVLDELPYMQILVRRSECGFTISSANNDYLPSFGGFGFAFQKGDCRRDGMSKAILRLSEDGTLQKLQSSFNIGDDSRDKCDSDDPSRLKFKSFAGLFIFVGCVYGFCLISHFIKKIWHFVKKMEVVCWHFSCAIWRSFKELIALV